MGRRPSPDAFFASAYKGRDDRRVRSKTKAARRSLCPKEAEATSALSFVSVLPAPPEHPRRGQGRGCRCRWLRG